MEKAGGIILRRTRLTETSLILSWLTSTHGRVKTVVKGALRPKSPFRGKVDLFYHCEILFSTSRTSDLFPLREAGILSTFDGLRTDYVRLAAASYFSELIEHSVELLEPVPEIFDLFLRALGFLDSRDPTLRAVTFFESELARHLGLTTAESSVAVVEKAIVSYAPLRHSRQALMKQLAPADFSTQSP